MDKMIWGNKIFKEGRGGKMGQGVGALKREGGGGTTPLQIMIFYHLIK